MDVSKEYFIVDGMNGHTTGGRIDTSKEYIAQCDCPEIQDGKPKQRGDLYYILIEQSVGSEIRTEEYFEYYGCDGFKYGESHKGRICWHKNEGHTTEYYQDEFGGRRTKKILWLPRIDQLQEMLGIKTIGDFEKKYIDKIVRIEDASLDNPNGDYCGLDYINTDISIEKALLRFIMKELHNKTWDGEKWK